MTTQQVVDILTDMVALDGVFDEKRLSTDQVTALEFAINCVEVAGSNGW